VPSQASGARRVIGHWSASDDSYFTGSERERLRDACGG
jgi:hypothetical protein